MKKLAVALAGALLVSLLSAATVSAGSGVGPGVAIVHGIGPPANNVDVYVKVAGATDWDLAVADLAYLEQVDIGTLPGGTYNALLCQAAPLPIDTIAGCADNGVPAITANTGVDFEIGPSGVAIVVASYSGPDTQEAGRPTVYSFEPDLSCVEAATPARLMAIHAALADPVDVIADGAVAFVDLAIGESVYADVPAGTYEIAVELADGGGPVVLPTLIPVDALELTVLVVVGNGDPEYGVVSLFTGLDPCEEPIVPTTVPTTVPAAQVTPAFTG